MAAVQIKSQKGDDPQAGLRLRGRALQRLPPSLPFLMPAARPLGPGPWAAQDSQGSLLTCQHELLDNMGQ